MPAIRSSLLAGAMLAVVVAACGASTHAAKSPATTVDPANFTGRVNNPWFPLTPGSTYRYRGTKDGKDAVEEFRVTRRTKRILASTTSTSGASKRSRRPWRASNARLSARSERRSWAVMERPEGVAGSLRASRLSQAGHLRLI